ncbi:MAG TPA: hypothetical protein VKZ57_10940 [Sphingobacterium sp.]|nr:hypothetical protein [Sphingobacterium sp.]
MKTLIIVIHPDMDSSVIHKRWVEELNKYPDRYDIHQLFMYFQELIKAIYEMQILKNGQVQLNRLERDFLM